MDAPALGQGGEVPRQATVLVVDDDDGVRSVAARALEHAGHLVLVADDGPRALLVADGHAGPIDALVTDLEMPGMLGTELAERLAAVRPGLPVLFVSGAVPLAEQLVGTFLAKPFRPAELQDRVAELLGSTCR